MSDKTETIWIKSEPALDGSHYVVTIEASHDRAVTLTPDKALRYAATVLDAVQRADYDAAVFRQLSHLVKDELAVVEMVRDLRKDRPPLNHAATEPLGLEPGVNAKFEPFLHLRLDGKLIGQWSLPDAREHALAVLGAVAVADLDSGYYRALRHLVGLEEGPARAAVADLANWRAP